MTRILTYISILFYITILGHSCATQQPVTGGTKDTIPPNLIETFPLNQSINFKSKEISLLFDEPIKEDQLQTKLIITPDDQNKFETLIKRNRLTLLFEKEFKDSTTYSLNFNSSIEDITEGNEADNVTLAFSTTSYIDSLSIEGYVEHLLSGEPQENITVALYLAGDSNTIFTKRPLYFSKTAKDGGFSIRNLKPQKYKLFAFNDENKNNLCEPDSEPHGFVPDTISLRQSLDSLTIGISRNDVRPITHISSRVSGRYFEVRYNKPLKNYSAHPVDSLPPTWIILSTFTEDRRGIVFFPSTNPTTDSLHLHITAADSSGNAVETNTFLKFQTSKRSLIQPHATALPSAEAQIPNQLSLTLNFNKPILYESTADSLTISIDTLLKHPLRPDTIYWQNGNTTASLQLTVPKTLVTQAKSELQTTIDSLSTDTTSADLRQAKLAASKWAKVKDNYTRIFLPKGTFITVDYDTIPSIPLPYLFIDPQEKGTIRGTVTTNHANYTIQLINTKFETVQELPGTVAYQFKNVNPGEYRIRVTVDENADGQWSPGNSLLGTAPEKVFIYPTSFTVRANWTLENVDLQF